MDNNIDNTNYLEEGTTLTGRYVIQSVIGAGGFGITYKAWDELMDCHVAIKEYYPVGLVSRQNKTTVSLGMSAYLEEFTRGKQRFLQEAKGLVKLKESQYVVNVQNFFEENQTAYMAMEFLEGDTLAHYYKKVGGRLSVSEALPIIEKVLIALSEIHNQKLIHRDISPENIFILPDGRVKLIDFGAAKQSYCGETQNISIILKLGYAPPEQYSNTSPQGPWTDIYAFGATMYRMLTGSKPLESLSRILNDSLIYPACLEKSIPAYLNNAIMKAMEIRPENRFQNALDFKAAIFDEEKRDNTQVKEPAENMYIQEEKPADDYIDKTIPVTGQQENSADVEDYIDKTMPVTGQQENSADVEDYIDKTMPVTGQQESNADVEDYIDKTMPVTGQQEHSADTDDYTDNAVSVKSEGTKDKSEKEEVRPVPEKKKTFKKGKRIGLISAVLLLILVSCVVWIIKIVNNKLPLPDVNSDEKIVIYSQNDELKSKLEYFNEKYPEYKDRIIYKTYSDYNSVVDAYNSGQQVDIVVCDIDNVSNFKNDMYVDMNEIGITDYMYNNSYKYTRKVGTVNNSLRAVTYQATEGFIIYRTDIAEEVFGTSDPDKIGKYFADWDSYLSAAERVKQAGYYMVSDTSDFGLGSMANKDLSSVIASVNNNGYAKGTSMWSIEDKSNANVFSCFACPWFVEYVLKDGNAWAVASPPEQFYWGGTYMGVTKACASSTERKRLAALVLYSVCCDEDIVYKMMDGTSDCPNNKKVVKKFSKLSSYPSSKVVNKNVFSVYKDILTKMNK